ncbi:MAG: CD225/dispanin family protein [Prevotella sp.]|nr:CD225/dispanin family protein [Prevotella sp.]
MENYQNQNAGYSNMMPVNDNKVLAIIALVLSVLCCNILSIIFAIIGLVKSSDVRKFQMMGQQALAEQSGKRAGLFSWIAIGLLVVGIILNAIFFFAMGGMEAYQEMLEGMMQK